VVASFEHLFKGEYDLAHTCQYILTLIGYGKIDNNVITKIILKVVTETKL